MTGPTLPIGSRWAAEVYVREDLAWAWRLMRGDRIEATDHGEQFLTAKDAVRSLVAVLRASMAGVDVSVMGYSEDPAADAPAPVLTERFAVDVVTQVFVSDPIGVGGPTPPAEEPIAPEDPGIPGGEPSGSSLGD